MLCESFGQSHFASSETDFRSEQTYCFMIWRVLPSSQLAVLETSSELLSYLSLLPPEKRQDKNVPRGLSVPTQLLSLKLPHIYLLASNRTSISRAAEAPAMKPVSQHAALEG